MTAEEEHQLGQHTEEPKTEHHSTTIEAEIKRNEKLWSKATCAWKVLCPAAALPLTLPVRPQFVVGMLDEKILYALAMREKEMPKPDAVVEPVPLGEFHSLLESVCADAGTYIDTLWDSGAMTATGRRDLEFLAAGKRIKMGQQIVSALAVCVCAGGWVASLLACAG